MSISLRLKSSCLGERNPSLKTLAWARLHTGARRGLAQVSPPHSGEWPSRRRALETDRGWVAVVLAQARVPRLSESFAF